MVNEFKLTVVHFARPLMSVPLRSEQGRGLAGMQRDKASVEWRRSEGGNPTDGWMLGRLLWKPTPKRGPFIIIINLRSPSGDGLLSIFIHTRNRIILHGLPRNRV